MKYSIILFVAILSGCSNPENSVQVSIQEAAPTSENSLVHSFIRTSIKAHFPEGLDQKGISFQFRDRFYSCYYDRGTYCFTRSYDTDAGSIRDTISNAGFFRFLNGTILKMSPEDSLKYMEGLNGVIYFGLLPYRLDDDAVISDSLEPQLIKGSKYHCLRVRFTEENGGGDFDDEFMYWFDWETHQLDYFAYKYHRDGGGIRFREAINRKEINGVVIQDYLNYSYTNLSLPLDSLANLFSEGQLELLSRIEFTNFTIN